jgi:hypothetical protein
MLKSHGMQEAADRTRSSHGRHTLTENGALNAVNEVERRRNTPEVSADGEPGRCRLESVRCSGERSPPTLVVAGRICAGITVREGSTRRSVRQMTEFYDVTPPAESLFSHETLSE